MIVVAYNHNIYRVNPTTGAVEVYIAETQQVRPKTTRAAHWRIVKRDANTALRVRMRAFNAERKRERAQP